MIAPKNNPHATPPTFEKQNILLLYKHAIPSGLGVRSWQSKYREAEPLLRRAVEIREKSLSVDHPDNQNVRENYALLLAEMKNKTSEV